MPVRPAAEDRLLWRQLTWPPCQLPHCLGCPCVQEPTEWPRHPWPAVTWLWLHTCPQTHLRWPSVMTDCPNKSVFYPLAHWRWSTAPPQPWPHSLPEIRMTRWFLFSSRWVCRSWSYHHCCSTIEDAITGWAICVESENQLITLNTHSWGPLGLPLSHILECQCRQGTYLHDWSMQVTGANSSDCLSLSSDGRVSRRQDACSRQLDLCRQCWLLPQRARFLGWSAGSLIAFSWACCCLIAANSCLCSECLHSPQGWSSPDPSWSEEPCSVLPPNTETSLLTARVAKPEQQNPNSFG